MVGSRRLGRDVAALVMSFTIAMSLGSPVAAQAPAGPDQGPITLTADHIEYDTQSGTVVADGHVVATRGSTTITAAHLTGNLNTGDVQASGHVVLTQPGRTATGEDLRYNYRTRVGEMSRAVAKYTPWTVTGRTITTAAAQGVATAASATPCDPAHPAFLVTARKVVIVPNERLTAYDAVLRVYGVPVFWVPAYTTSLHRGRAASGPTVGYDNFNGAWAEYSQYVPLGDWESQIRVRLATRSGLSGEAVVDRHFPGYLVTAHLGRAVTFDQNGNQFNLDQYTLDAATDTQRVGGLPLSYAFEVQAGNFNETQTGVNAFRTEGLLTLSADTINLTPSLSAAAGGYYRYDTYSTGNTRNIAAAAAALTQTFSKVSSATLSYNFAQVTGATPFAFDSIASDSAITLSYSYYPPGKVFQSGTIFGTYDYITQQTTAGLILAFTLSPSLQFATNVLYNVTTRQWAEIDYEVGATCDCVSLGVVYRTFPTAPSTNQWYVTLGIATLPGTATQFRFGGAPSPALANLRP
ncbi:MAG TPA: LptA/OstA family protein [bacterium]|nr:LptA/OstA family protein [bacterium]